MNSMADFEFDKLPLMEEIILVSQWIRRDFPVDKIRQSLQQLTEQAMTSIDMAQDQDQQLMQFIVLFYQQWGFNGSKESPLSEMLWLDKVLNTRQGVPISLGVIFLHLAHQLGLPLQPVIFPTQLILRADWLDEEIWLIDPLNGETLSETQLEHWIKNHLGAQASLQEKDFDEADNRLVIGQLFSSLRLVLQNEQQHDLVMRISEVLHQFKLEDPRIICDPRLILTQCSSDPIVLTERAMVQRYLEGSHLEGIKVDTPSWYSKKKMLH